MKEKVNNSGRPAASVFGLALVAAALPISVPLYAKKVEAAVVAPRPTYARVADLVNDSAAIAVVSVKNLTLLPPERATGVAAGMQRYLVTADTQSLIRGNDVLARSASFLIDLPGTAKSKPPRWKGRRFLIFGAVESRVDFFQLLSSRALISWSAENEALVRKVAAEMTAVDAPPRIKGVDSVFHVAGAVQGAGETQIFLTTGDGSPISLSIIRKPDEKPQFGVSLGEIVDEAAAMPAADTPLWYRLSCFLLSELPSQALAGQQGGDATAASRDYAAFRSALAACDRSPTPLD